MTLFLVGSEDDVQVALIMISLGAVGFACLVYSVTEIRRNKSLHNAFGVLCCFHSIGHIGVLAGYTLWIAPVTICGHGLRDSRLDQEVAALISFFYVTTTYAHVFKGLNRLAAVYTPSAYRRMFSIRGTLKLIAFGLLLCIGHNLPYHIRGCHGYYDADTWSFMYASSDCAQNVAYYDDFYFTIGSAGVVLVIDVAVFVRLRMLSRRLQQKRREHCGNVCCAIPARDEVLFSVLLTVLLLSWLFVAPIAATTKWSAFFFYTLNAELYHVVDGMALCLFVRRLCRRTAANVSVSIIGRSVNGRSVNSVNQGGGPKRCVHGSTVHGSTVSRRYRHVATDSRRSSTPELLHEFHRSTSE